MAAGESGLLFYLVLLRILEDRMILETTFITQICLRS